ncbi:uncharacterized protein At1g76070-like [Chenopodium quinoa]|uniref:uncharacterized protein At1g76070-like n=1 Tax=Chenopodium quinoa TaxID=63459 RepID=UPI000B77B2A7|nr:uncharacterized protein At1g76070-like [Chenopodium quinoa]
MENSNKSKNLFLKFLPKAASAVSFQNPQFSPGRDHHHHHHNHHSSKAKAHAHKGFSGPINYSVLPDEAREKPKKDGSTYEAHEPTSPKVSCMGQIKYKHKKKKLRKIASKNKTNNVFLEVDHQKMPSTKSSPFSKFFNKSLKKSKGSHQSEEHGKEGRRATLDNNNQKKKNNVPSLGMMNKFASGRETLANFDWTAQIAPLDHDRDYYSDDEEIRRANSDDDDEDDNREVIIPYSAPMLIGGRSRDNNNGTNDVIGGRRLSLEPRKEVNLWKRRTMAPPPPLALNSNKVRS